MREEDQENERGVYENEIRALGVLLGDVRESDTRGYGWRG